MGFLVEEILKFDFVVFEVGGVYVCEVVCDCIQILLLGFYVGGGGVEGEIYDGGWWSC